MSSAVWFTVYTDEHAVEDEAEWDEAARLAQQGSKSSVVASEGSSRSLCHECGKPLRRIAKVPGCSTLLHCSSRKECERCDQLIFPGELHFCCSQCQLRVCKSCGPGVYIERHYDFFDTSTGEGTVEDMPASVWHQRKAYRGRVRKTRSANLQNVRSLANEVVGNVHKLCEFVAEEEYEYFDQEWDIDNVLLRLLGVNSMAEAADAIEQLTLAATEIFKSQPVLLRVPEPPCKIFGDIHGQLRDLLLLFKSFGMPGTSECSNAVFNGDFVDRGKHQLEVIVVLFALKVAYPDQVCLNRGNHEDNTMNARYGFQKACNVLGAHTPRIFQVISTAFSFLPLATLISGKILVLHGGIGDGNWQIRALDRVKRPLSHEDITQPENKWLWNILWSDPIEDDQRHTKVFGVHPSPRSKSAVKFGWNVTQLFCAKNGIDLIVRSHQAKKAGLGFDVMHHETLIRVFSARDYESNGNDGAVLNVTREDQDDDDEEEEAILTVRAQVLGSLLKDGR
mmetsp:Transcript_47971/g.148376  ORF Transcript_47971/g.148376 Transcript_47971/m.148376 type:complete len:507 (+) Transcript_47971:61-1581(+)